MIDFFHIGVAEHRVIFCPDSKEPVGAELKVLTYFLVIENSVPNSSAARRPTVPIPPHPLKVLERVAVWCVRVVSEKVKLHAGGAKIWDNLSIVGRCVLQVA